MAKVPSSVRQAVYERDNHQCQECGNTDWRVRRKSVHHCFTVGQYRGEDGDQEWNLVLLCEQPCHVNSADCVQNSASKSEKYRKLAYSRRPTTLPQFPIFIPYMTVEQMVDYKRSTIKPRIVLRKKDERAASQRKQEYNRKVESFKAKNGGLTPWQAAYRRNKALKTMRNSATI